MMREMRLCAKMEIRKRIMKIVGYQFIRNVVPKRTTMHMIHTTDEI